MNQRAISCVDYVKSRRKINRSDISVPVLDMNLRLADCADRPIPTTDIHPDPPRASAKRPVRKGVAPDSHPVTDLNGINGHVEFLPNNRSWWDSYGASCSATAENYSVGPFGDYLALRITEVGTRKLNDLLTIRLPGGSCTR
jgi:hypothetical protein